jgi:GNAT superfamily N-acetyltransferase
MSPTVIRVCGPDGRVLDATRLARAEAVHRQLRPNLPHAYVETLTRIFGDGGEMAVALIGERVAGVAVYRVYLNTFAGTRFYVDDLVTDEADRSTGVGHALLAWLETEARARGCPGIELESGVQRARAHRFYFREGFSIPSFSFRKSLS